MELYDRFMKFVDKTDTCWIWKGCKDKRGYGKISIKNYPYLAHRISFELHTKKPSLFILHSCDNPSCVNPNHLREGTHQDNMKDRNDRQRCKPSMVRGNQHGMSKLKEEDILKIRELFNTGYTANQISKQFNIGRNNLYFIRDRKTWTHI